MKKRTRNLMIVSLPFFLAGLNPHQATAKTPGAPGPSDSIPVDVTGRVTQLISDDFKKGISESSYWLEELKTKTRYRLRPDAASAKKIQSGAIIRIHGRAKNQEIEILGASDSPATSSLDNTTSTTSGSTSIVELAPAAIGVADLQKTLVMVVHFTDSAVSCPVSDINDLMFNNPNRPSVADLYQEMSFNRVSFTGTVTAVTINASIADSCNMSAWSSSANTLASGAGFDLTQYQRIIYVLPSNTQCPVAGSGEVGVTPSRAWIFRCSQADAYAHELGHNLGLGHANTATTTYADTSDIMGYSGYMYLKQVNGPHKAQLGWLPPANVSTVTQSGTYDIGPLELDPQQLSLPQTIRVAKPDTQSYYYLSYRQPLGFDANLSSSYLNRLTIHRYSGSRTADTALLQTLSANGFSYTDTVNNIKFTQLSFSPDKVTVQIDLSQTCQQSAPLVNLSPMTQSGAPGTTLSYTVTMSNSDRTACPSSQFNLTPSLPLGWSGNLTMTSISLAPGQSSTATLTVTAPSNTASASYGIAVKVSDPASALHSASAGGTFVVSNCIRSTPLLQLLPSIQSSSTGSTLSYVATLTNQDSTDCAATTFNMASVYPSGWTGNLSNSNLLLSPGQKADTTFNLSPPGGISAGSYSFTISTQSSSSTLHAISAAGTYQATTAGDAQAPTVPVGLSGKSGRKQINLSWNASTDNVMVTSYNIWRNGLKIGTVSTTSYSDKAVVNGQSYIYTVSASDAAGNTSAQSAALTVTK